MKILALSVLTIVFAAVAVGCSCAIGLGVWSRTVLCFLVGAVLAASVTGSALWGEVVDQ